MPNSKATTIIVASGLAFAALLWLASEHGTGPRNPVAPEMAAERSKGLARGGTVGAEQMRVILQGSASSILVALNETGAMNVSAAAVQVLAAAWKQDRAAEPMINWAEMKRLDVRFALANELVRAYANGTPGVPIEEVAAFGREHLAESGDIVTTSRAMFLVTLGGNDTDIGRVEQLLQQTQSNAVFEAGISALLSTCRPAAAEAIKRLQSQQPDPFRASLIQHAMERSAAFRARRCEQVRNEDTGAL